MMLETRKITIAMPVMKNHATQSDAPHRRLSIILEAEF